MRIFYLLMVPILIVASAALGYLLPPNLSVKSLDSVSAFLGFSSCFSFYTIVKLTEQIPKQMQASALRGGMAIIIMICQMVFLLVRLSIYGLPVSFTAMIIILVMIIVLIVSMTRMLNLLLIKPSLADIKA